MKIGKSSSLVLVAAVSFGCSHARVDRVIASRKHLKNTRASDSSPLVAWTEIGPNGSGIARAITADSSCPAATIDSKSVNMQERASPTVDGRFPERVCELSIPAGAQVAVAGRTLAGIPDSPKRILVLGDTGCRIKVKSNGKEQIQDCNDANGGWPFAEVAAMAAKKNPDLVIHVGDYHYREAACPPGDQKCAGSIPGDNWSSWSEDFFAPVQPLLSAAPWVFVRGNHEICSRAQEGFFRFLDPRALPSACEDVTAPYAIRFGNLALAVLDSSASDISAKDISSVESLPVNGAWLVTHRPPWMSEEAKAAGDGDEGDTSLPSGPAEPIGVPSNIGLVLTGHQHLFRATTFADGRAPQMIIGNGGTLLETHPASEMKGTPVDSGGTTLASASTFVDFGFMLLRETGTTSWSAEVYDKSGGLAVTCALAVSKHSKKIIRMNCSGS